MARRNRGTDRAAEAEQALLGALMLEASALERVRDVVRPRDFSTLVHRLIFIAITHASAKGNPDGVAVCDELGDKLEEVGGREYIASLVQAAASAANVATYAQITREHAARRAVADIGARLSRAAANGADVATAELVRRAREELLELEAVDDDPVQIITGNSLSPEPIDWLWRDYLARGKFHAHAGAPGTGKTTLALCITATLTIGGRWPDQTPAPLGDALIWSGEDDVRDTLLPRLIAMGADTSRVHFVGDVGRGGARRAFDPATDVLALLSAARRIANPLLLVVDPVVMALGSADSHKNTETRRALQPLVDVASAMNVALIGISHFSKGSAGRDPIERITGSVAFGALPRVVFGSVRSAEDGSRRFVRCKSNIGPDGGGFVYHLEQLPLAAHPGIVASTVAWGDPLEGTARDLLAVAEATEDPDERSALREAEDFLLEELAHGRVRSDDLQRKAKSQGIAERTLKRARTALRVASRKDGPHWFVSLPEEGQENGLERF